MKSVNIKFIANNQWDEDKLDLKFIIEALQEHSKRCTGEYSVPLQINTAYEGIPILIDVQFEKD